MYRLEREKKLEEARFAQEQARLEMEQRVAAERAEREAKALEY